MHLVPQFRIVILASGIGWPRGHCALRGDLGCLASHAKAAGYRADGLADRLGVAPRLLRRAFQDAFGIALKNRLVQVRSVEVRNRLREWESISEIAGSVGFSHAKELSREFRKAYQVTPTAYRRRERLASQGAGSRVTARVARFIAARSAARPAAASGRWKLCSMRRGALRM